MGFKMATIFVSDQALGYFNTEPKHSLDSANQIIERLSLGPAEPAESVLLGEALVPYYGAFGLGAYMSGFALADRRLYGQVTNPNHALRDLILSTFPSSNVLALELDSGSNLYGYALYESGRLVRALGGFYDGCLVDVGQKQPEEIPHFSNAKMIDNELQFPSKWGLRKLYQYGENLVFAMATRCLGKGVERFIDDEQGPEMQMFNLKGETRSRTAR